MTSRHDVYVLIAQGLDRLDGSTRALEAANTTAERAHVTYVEVLEGSSNLEAQRVMTHAYRLQAILGEVATRMGDLGRFMHDYRDSI